jgi:hypothetical protein
VLIDKQEEVLFDFEDKQLLKFTVGRRKEKKTCVGMHAVNRCIRSMKVRLCNND